MVGEKIFDLISKIATGEKRRFFWATAIVILVVLIIVYPYIDANLLYYNRMEKRLDNLGKLMEISGQTISDSPELEAEYQSILDELSLARERTIFGSVAPTKTQENDYWIKLISGGLLFGLVGIIGLFSNKKGVKMSFSLFLKNNLIIFIVCGVLAILCSFVFLKVPTLGSVWVNAILAPSIQLFVIYLLLQPKKKND